MNQLHQVTQENSSISQSTASSAQSLSTQAEELRHMVRDLFFVIHGSIDGNSVANFLSVNESPQAIASPEEPLVQREVVRASKSTNFEVPSKDDPRFEDV
jgi:hypothetical protein